MQSLVRRGILTSPLADYARRIGARSSAASLPSAKAGDLLALIDAIVEIGFEAPHRLGTSREAPTVKA